MGGSPVEVAAGFEQFRQIRLENAFCLFESKGLNATVRHFQLIAEAITPQFARTRNGMRFLRLSMIRFSGQIEGIEKGDNQGQNRFILGLFGLATKARADRFL